MQRWFCSMIRVSVTVFVLSLSSVVLAAPNQPQNNSASPDILSRPIFLVVALALVSLLPILFMATTAFVKISTVLQITRSAIGAQNVPSNTVLLALAASLSLVAMAPVGQTIIARGAPIVAKANELDTSTLVSEGFKAVSEPLRAFMRANATPKELARFVTLARAAQPATQRDTITEADFLVVAPAFVVSELNRAFLLGIAIFLPFLILDLVVANILVAAGLSSLSPSQIALPLKLLLFVAVDGWGLLARSLILGYQLS